MSAPQFGDRNPADVLQDPMWQMFKTFGQRENIPALEEYVHTLIQMSIQKDAGQAEGDGKKRTKKNASWDEELNMTLWGIVIEACALVLSGKLELLVQSERAAREEIIGDAKYE